MIVWGSASHHERASVRRNDRRSGRRQCLPGHCPNPCTHAGVANGVHLMIGCQFHVAMWVRDPIALIDARIRARKGSR